MFTQSLASALKHKNEGKTAFALVVLSGALSNAISQVVTDTATPTEGIALLRRLGIKAALDEFTQLNAWAFCQLSSEPVRCAVVNEPALVCLAWLCEANASASALLEVLRSERVQRHFPLTGFAREFASALLCLADSKPYTPTTVKIKGYEHFLLPYLQLASDLSHGRDLTSALHEVHLAFQTRNKDKRLVDWRTIDGDGKRPVRWDFRREALLRFKQTVSQPR